MDPQKPAGSAAAGGQQGLRRAHTVAQTGNPPRPGRLRTNSLRRTNNSNELIRQGPLESPSSSSDGVGSRSDGREGRYFTVGNVGNNGKIYLRYVVNDWRGYHLAFSCIIRRQLTIFYP